MFTHREVVVAVDKNNIYSAAGQDGNVKSRSYFSGEILISGSAFAYISLTALKSITDVSDSFVHPEGIVALYVFCPVTGYRSIRKRRDRM